MIPQAFTHPGWVWQPDKCPADEYFIEWLRHEGPRQSNVFHMGTGMHHAVGNACVDMGIPCLGVTASLEEYLSPRNYSQLYQVYLADIYTIDDYLLPTAFTAMSFFHLGEMVDLFGDINVEAIKNLILYHTAPGGLVLFYNGSSAWDRAKDAVQQFVSEDVLKPHGQYKSLLVYES